MKSLITEVIKWLCFADSGILWEGGPKTYQPINQTEILVITLEYN